MEPRASSADRGEGAGMGASRRARWLDRGQDEARVRLGDGGAAGWELKWDGWRGSSALVPISRHGDAGLWIFSYGCTALSV